MLQLSGRYQESASVDTTYSDTFFGRHCAIDIVTFFQCLCIPNSYSAASMALWFRPQSGVIFWAYLSHLYFGIFGLAGIIEHYYEYRSSPTRHTMVWLPLLGSCIPSICCFCQCPCLSLGFLFLLALLPSSRFRTLGTHILVT